MTARVIRFWTFWGVLVACGMVAGCSNSTATQSTSSSGDGSSGGATAVEFPDGDPSVPADLGGPGFTGEGWTTATPRPLGDPAAVKGGTMLARMADWPDNLRVYGLGANTVQNDIFSRLCYDTLCDFDMNTLEFVPRLASHWKISDDNMKFAFRINPKAHWSDGKPVTADDVIATFRLLMDETLKWPSVRDDFSKMNEPVAKSKYMVEIECKKKDWLNFLNVAREMLILPAHEIGGMKGEQYLNDYNFKFTVGSGAYIIPQSEIRTKDSVTLTRRKDYWAANDPFYSSLYNIDKIRFVVVLDDRLAFEKAGKGDLDFYLVNTAKWWVEDLPQLEGVKKGHLIRQKIYTKAPVGIQGLAFNIRKPPLDDVRIRKAIAHLFDRKTMVEKFAYNEYELSKSYFAGSDAENPDNQLVEFSPEKATKLLADAGWSKRGSDGILVKDGKRLSVKLSYSSKFFEKYYTSFQEDCKRAGVELVLDYLTDEAFWPMRLDHKFEIAQQGWALDMFPSPKSMFHSSMADPKGSSNVAGFKNAEADKLIEEYDQEFDIAKRMSILRRLDGVVFNEHPYALQWGISCERVLYVNKFGLPATGLRKFDDNRGPFYCWWVDPSKEERLKKARQAGEPITPIPPIEIRPWNSEAGKTAQR